MTTQFGKAITSVGDINHDNIPDFAIGDPVLSSEQPGSVYLYYGSENFSATPDKIFQGENAGDQFGYSIASSVIDGDNQPDLMMTALGQNGIGKVYLSLTGGYKHKTSYFKYLLVFVVLLMILALVIKYRNRIPFLCQI